MSELTDIKQLLHDGLELARKRIVIEGGFSPFMVTLEGDQYNVMESINMTETNLDDIILAFRENNARTVNAFICCIDSKINLPEEGVSMNAIVVALESGDTFIKCHQLYGKNAEGETVFAPLEVSETNTIKDIGNE